MIILEFCEFPLVNNRNFVSKIIISNYYLAQLFGESYVGLKEEGKRLIDDLLEIVSKVQVQN